MAAAKKGSGELQQITSSMCHLRHALFVACLLVCSDAGIEIAGVYNDGHSLDLQEAGMREAVLVDW